MPFHSSAINHFTMMDRRSNIALEVALQYMTQKVQRLFHRIESYEKLCMTFQRGQDVLMNRINHLERENQMLRAELLGEVEVQRTLNFTEGETDTDESDVEFIELILS